MPDYKTLLHQLPGRYLFLDPQFRIIGVTDEYLAASHTVRSEILGRELFSQFPVNPSEERAAAERNLKSSLERAISTLQPDSMSVQRYDVVRPESEGGGFIVKYWSTVNTPVCNSDGELTHLVSQIEDVTDFVQFCVETEEEKKINRELRSDIGQMQAEILRRSASLHEANEKLRKASEAKNVFLGRVSHELRSPLTAVIGYSELMQLDAAPGSEAAESADAILRAGTHLLDMINEMLDIAQIESGHVSLNMDHISLDGILDDVAQMVQPLAAERSIGLELRRSRSALYVRADRQRLNQVMINLVANAVKYNREGGWVRIVVEPPSGSCVQVSVSDSGRGIDPEDFDEIFEPFHRLGAETTDVEGTGLGLALSRTLIEQMGGTISVESAPGTGSTFSVTLPLEEPKIVDVNDVGSAAELNVVAYPDEKKILYVEDTSFHFQIVESVLRRRPQISLTSATLGRLGLEIAREQLPDLILLDLHLPDMHGIEALTQLKADDATRHIPVVVLSADATNRQKSEAIDLGAKNFLTKPIRAQNLLRTVDSILK